MLYYLIIGLQIICAYHVYKTKNNVYWYLVIILIPGIGCAIYTLTQILNKSDVNIVQNELASVIHPSKKIKELEEKVAFADTFQNRINLADALQRSSNYQEAEVHYQEALSGNHASDYYANSQLLSTFFEQEKYEHVVEIAKILSTKSEFDGSKCQFLYGLALSKLGQELEAENILKKVDKRYSNYPERLTLVKFYIEHKKNSKATQILEDLKAESLNLTKPNRVKYKSVFSEINSLVVPS